MHCCNAAGAGTARACIGNAALTAPSSLAKHPDMYASCNGASARSTASRCCGSTAGATAGASESRTARSSVASSRSCSRG